MNTNTPLRALTTLNDITYTEAARVMAEKIISSRESEEERLTYAFEWTTSRPPVSHELSILKNRLDSIRAEFDEDPPAAKKIIATGEYPVNQRINPTEYAAFTVISSLLLNLDETITRQ